MRKVSFTLIGLFLILIFCSTLRAELKPDKKSEKFLSLVRYIITDEEVDMYKEYPPFEREEFISKFWARRDPNPNTIKNEFQEEYFQRITKSNKLFKGMKGWLQDRGWIYILFGPPDNTGGYPQYPIMIWTYNRIHRSVFSPAATICFIDYSRTGDYRIASNINLPNTIKNKANNPLLANILSLSTINDLAEQIKHDLLLGNTIFNFQWKFITEQNREKNSNLNIHLEMPYERIIFQHKNDQLIAEMELFIEIRDEKQNLFWDSIYSYNLSFDRVKLYPEKEGMWTINIPVTNLLPKGKYTFYIHLLNLSVDQDVKKLLNLKI